MPLFYARDEKISPEPRRGPFEAGESAWGQIAQRRRGRPSKPRLTSAAGALTRGGGRRRLHVL